MEECEGEERSRSDAAGSAVHTSEAGDYVDG